MLTFFFSHHRSGKTVAKFCTHKGYRRGGSTKVIADMARRAPLREIDPVSASSNSIRNGENAC